MRAITVDAYGKAEAGITFVNESFGFVPFDSFRIPLHRNLADGIIAGHAVMVRNHTTLAGELVSFRDLLLAAAPVVAAAAHWGGKRPIDGGAQDFLTKFSSQLSKLSAGTAESGKAETLNPLPPRFYRAELGKTSKAGPLLVPERDSNDERLLVLFSSGVGYKQTLRVKGPEGKVIASGFSRGFKRTMQTMLVWIEPGDEVEVRMSGSTNTQAVGFERSYAWDGTVLSLHQSRSSGRNGSEKFYGEDGVKARIIPAELETKEQAAEQAVYAEIAALVADRTTRDAQVKTIRQEQLALFGAHSRLTARLDQMKAKAASFGQPDWQPSIFGDLTEEDLAKAEAEFVEAEAKAAMKAAFVGLENRFGKHGYVVNTTTYPDHFAVRTEHGSSEIFSYNEEGKKELLAFLDQLDAEAAEAKAKTDAEAALNARYAEAASLGLPSNVEIWRRRGGATNAGDGWVVQPNGMPRERDEMLCPRPRYPDEGTQVWKQILPGELVLQWSKAMTAAEHVFEVVYKPETLTEAQLRTVALLQEELAADWEGRRGLASGNLSPEVGEGWGLLPKAEKPKVQISQQSEVLPVVTPVAQGGQKASENELAALLKRFGK